MGLAGQFMGIKSMNPRSFRQQRPAQPWVGLGHSGLPKLAEVVFAEAVHPDEVGGAFRGWGGSRHDN